QLPDANRADPAKLPDDLGVLGAWYVDLDPAAITGGVSPIRTGEAFGDSWWLNATGFLDNRPCGDCLALEGIQNDPAGLRLKFRVRHPFAPGDPSLPVSATNRLDLHVFDAQLLVAGELGETGFAFSSAGRQLPTRLVVDPSGYSGLLQPAIAGLLPTASSDAWPYVTLNEDPTTGNVDPSSERGFTDVQNPAGHNVFPMGADVPAELVLGLTPADGPVRVLVLFTASYGHSAVGRTQRLQPRYALPEYNAKPAWKVEATLPVSDLHQGDTGSSAQLQVRVWDWQVGAPVDPALNTLNSIRAESAPSLVEAIVPGVLTAPVNLGAAASGTGPYDDPLVYQTVFTNQANADEGTYVGAVRVVDSRSPGLNAGGQPDALSSSDGITLDNVSVAEFATYQTFSVDVLPPVVTRVLQSIDITPTARQIIDQGPAGAVLFTATGNFSEPPLTEDITGQVTWQSSATDVGTFATNVLTGVGMGVTQVTATLSSVTSNATAVVVKPVEMTSIFASSPQGIDADQNGGTIFVSAGGGIRKYNPADGSFISNFPTNFPARTITYNEATGQLIGGASYGSPSPNVWVYDAANGTQIATYHAPVPGCSGPNGLHVTDNGQLWSTGFCGTPYDMAQYNIADGTLIGGWDAPQFSAQIGVDGKDGLYAIANVGWRYGGQGLVVASQTTQAVLAAYSIHPNTSVYGQNDYVAFDRNGFIHMIWTGNQSTGHGPLIQVYEFTPGSPATLSLLYTYGPSNTGQFLSTGMGISRPGNNVACSHWNFTGQQRITFFN
ncbi:MAG TPA: hypothetical protein VEI97_12445, partial [bacterium]|nr:hypothetical protein [bacterium]